MKHLEVYIDKTDDDSPWVTGSIGAGNYEFYAKVEDGANKKGVENGRITKLVIRKGEVKDQTNETQFWNDVVANFDRTWIIKPKDSIATELFYAVLDELEKISVYKKRIYRGSLMNQFITKTKNAFSMGTTTE